MSSADTFRILITTDNHVGYQENDPVRGDDSWKTFEEIMYIAKEQDVDFVLQAGDLFHINKPTKKSMFHVMKSLRTICYGDKPIEFELLSDPAMTIDNRGLNHANFQDPNINVSIPLFAIAGNHDDSTGDELLDPMDLLSVSGLINHFGKNLENDKVVVSPLLLQKGSTKVALYGLSNIRDERLYKTFLDGNVKFLRASGEHQDEFFNLLAVHQNHTAHTDTSYLPESFLPNFLDFIVWGHEHECIPYVTPAPNGGVVLQPGSSVATSLSPAEMAQKHVFLLSITEKEYQLEALPLKTARPFIMKSIDLTESDIMVGSGNKKEVIRYLTDEIESLIKSAQDEWLELNKEEEEDDEYDEDGSSNTEEVKNGYVGKKVPLPLIRLKVEYTDGYEIENQRRFSNRFVEQVANVNDVVLFHRKKVTKNQPKKSTKRQNQEVLQDTELQDVNVTGLIDSFLEDDDLNIISKNDIADAIKVFVEKEDKNALKDFVKLELEKDFKELLKLDTGTPHDALDEPSQNGNGNSASYMKKGFVEILKEISKEKKSEAKRAEAAKSKHKSSEMVINSDSDLDVGPADNKRILVSGSSSDVNSEIEVARPPPRRKARAAAKKQTDFAEIVSESDGEIMSDAHISSDDSASEGDDDVDVDVDVDDDDDLVDIPPPKKPGRNSKVVKSSTRGRGRGGGRGGSSVARGKKMSSSKKPVEDDSQNVLDLVKRMANKK